MDTLDELREKILHNYDVDLLVEVLQIDADELLDRFEDRLVNMIDEGKFYDIADTE